MFLNGNFYQYFCFTIDQQTVDPIVCLLHRHRDRDLLWLQLRLCPQPSQGPGSKALHRWADLVSLNVYTRKVSAELRIQLEN
jgi:hypothetical protein